mgnify:CR=1 FL=1
MTEVKILHYDMAPGVVAFSTMRQGGCSTGNYGSLNINRYCGDDETHIARNREALCQLLGISDDRLVMPHQTHDTRVACIDERFLSLAMAERQAALEGIDALMTNQQGVCIGVSTADCIPLLLYDPHHHAACAVHAGWRGTVARIAQKAVKAMSETYGTQPTELTAQIGPGISLDSFEVGQEVYDAFAAAGFDMSVISKRYPAHTCQHLPSPFGDEPGARLKWHINLTECNRQQLLTGGLCADRIHLCGICTYKAYDTYFSARRLGIHSGRIFTGILYR